MTEQDELMIAEELFNWIHPVGSYYETSDINWSPQKADWYGTWVEDTEGLALVSRNSGTFKNVGDVIGEERHTLTGKEIPKFSRWNSGESELESDSQITGGAVNPGEWWGFKLFKNNEGGQSHNNIQPSKVCIRWHRIA